MPKITVNAINLYYEVHGTGTPLVLIGGIKSDHKTWANVLDPFAKQFQVVIFDNRSVGQSDNSNLPYSIHDMAQDVIALIDALQIKRPHILGHSMGGAIAQTLAAFHSEKINKLVLSNTFAQITPVSRIALENVLDLHRMNAKPDMIMKHLIPWAFSNEFLQNPNVLPTLLSLSAQNPFPQTTLGYQQQLEATLNFNSTKWLHTITAPTLIIGATSDILTPLIASQFLSRHITHSTLKVLPGGHPTSIEQQSDFIRCVCDFLKEA